MIAHLKGVIAERFGNFVIVDVGGVGYEVLLTGVDAEGLVLGAEVKFYVYHNVREAAEDLFGFLSLEGKKLFELLITVQGVGPKNAMAVLSLGSPEEVRNAIANADAEFVARASGVGKKSAERVIVNLRDKVGLPAYYGRRTGVQTDLALADEALEALMALGFQLADATRALSGVDAGLPVEERVRLALKK